MIFELVLKKNFQFPIIQETFFKSFHKILFSISYCNIIATYNLSKLQLVFWFCRISKNGKVRNNSESSFINHNCKPASTNFQPQITKCASSKMPDWNTFFFVTDMRARVSANAQACSLFLKKNLASITALL